MGDRELIDSEPTHGMPLTRRRVVAGAGVVAAASALAVSGCATNGQQPSGGSAGSGGSTGTGPLAKTSDIPVGGGKVFPDQAVVVTQPTAKTFKAFTAICTHTRCLVDDVSGGTINCPCHGSRYRIADGTVARGPAPRPLAEKTVTVSNGEISVSA